MARAQVPGFRPATLLCIALCGALGPAAAQESTPSPPPSTPATSAPRDIPRPEQLEPAVDTTAIAPAVPSASGNAVAAGGKIGSAPSSEAAGKAATPATARTQATKSGAGKRPDRLELDTTDITGNRELPKVLYIVPWKRSDLGDLVGRPVNSLLDEVLQPLDRDVFQRENRYYDALKPDAAGPKPAAVQGSGDRP